MKFSILLMLFVSVILSGCTTKPVYVDRPVKVNIPVPCKVQDPDCPHLQDLNSSEVIVELGRCIDQYDENIKVCEE